MKFNITQNKSIFSEQSEKTDEQNILTNTIDPAKDLGDLYSDICPISGEVFTAMKDAAKDPANLKLTAVKMDCNNENAQIYIEYTEFANFIEATNSTILDAKDTILDYCSHSTPQLDNAEFHVVFPSECLNKNVIGGENMGKATANDWPMQLMRGCRRFGIKVNTGIAKGDPSINTESTSFDKPATPSIPSVDDGNNEDASQAQLDKALSSSSKANTGGFGPVAKPSGPHNEAALPIDVVKIKNMTAEKANEFLEKFKKDKAAKKSKLYSKKDDKKKGKE